MDYINLLASELDPAEEYRRLHAHEGLIPARVAEERLNAMELQTIAHPTLKPQKKPAVRQAQ